MKESNKLILVGAFGSAVGLKGEVKLASFTEIPEAIADLAPLLADDGREFEIASIRPQTKGLVARVKGISTREAAEKLKGIALYVPRDALPEPEEEGEYYHADLIGLSAVLVSGKPLGKVIAVQNFGAGDLLEIQLANEPRTVFVPFTNDIVPEVDLAAGRLTIDPSPGLLDDAAREKPPAGSDQG
ncbi:MAG TPA: ribosome maturation factor RimM [Alphaproteobacteria bacterium]|nr:ribosome maturation factor RimM [Alphaproteobacteria bacterium]